MGILVLLHATLDIKGMVVYFIRTNNLHLYGNCSVLPLTHGFRKVPFLIRWWSVEGYIINMWAG